MDEENVWSGWQIVAMFWGLGSAAGDHVQKSASREPQQPKQLQDSQQLLEMSKRLLFYTALDYDTLRKSTSESADREHMRVHPRKHHHSWRRTLPLHGTHDKSLQSIMRCHDDIHKNLHDGLMLFDDTDALKGIIERMTMYMCM